MSNPQIEGFRPVWDAVDVDCSHPTSFVPSEKVQRMSLVVFVHEDGAQMTQIWCPRAKEGNGNCGKNGKVCVFSLSETNQPRVEVNGDIQKPTITTNTVDGKVSLNTKEQQVTVEGGIPTHLQKAEAVLLEIFMGQPGVALPDEQLFRAYDRDTQEGFGEPQNVRLRVHISKLRKKLTESAKGRSINIIKTVASKRKKLNISR